MRLLVLTVLTALLLQGCTLVDIELQPRIRPLREETVEGEGKAKILLMDVSGVLADETGSVVLGTPPPRVPIVARVREELQKAEDDDEVRALIVRINSPGGTITASDLIYREIEVFKTRRKVPVITIMTLPTTVTGSIGVVMLTVNAQGLMEKIGVAPLAIKSGAMKDAGSPFRPLTEQERAVFQSVIDEMYARFVSLIVRSRKMPEDKVRAAADGRIYTAEQAKALRLVDEIGYMDDAVAAARKAAGVAEARVVMYHRPKEYRANYYSTAPAPTPGVDTTLQQLTALVSGSGARFLYLWWP